MGQISPPLPIIFTAKPNRAPLLLKLKMIESCPDLEMIHFNPTSETFATVHREVVENSLKELLTALDDAELPAEGSENLITPQMLKVLPPDSKKLICIWAKARGHLHIVENINLREDLDEYTWSTGKAKVLPESWSSHPAYQVWQEVEEWARENLDHPIIPNLAKIKSICEDQEHTGVIKGIHKRFDRQEREFQQQKLEIQRHNEIIYDNIKNLNENLWIINKKNDKVLKCVRTISQSMSQIMSQSTSSSKFGNEATAARLTATGKRSSTHKNKGNAKQGDKSNAKLNTKVYPKGGNQDGVEGSAMVVSDDNGDEDSENDDKE